MESCLRLDFFNDLQEPKRHPDGTESHPKSQLLSGCLLKFIPPNSHPKSQLLSGCLYNFIYMMMICFDPSPYCSSSDFPWLCRPTAKAQNRHAQQEVTTHQKQQLCPSFSVDKTWMVLDGCSLVYHLVMTNIAMERSTMLLISKSSISMDHVPWRTVSILWPQIGILTILKGCFSCLKGI